ncbi:right-handed parallel beta-helix repeat-containing protein [Novosphingobium colocasiae]|uniref:right-handed parallel beta-helix repeat-containing protein n=1 Tax=Novosphingobium colocasiae TaxID=1256513 RepID=UPI0035AED6BD
MFPTSRRRALQIAACAVGGSGLIGACHGKAVAGSGPADWPSWSASRAQILTRSASLRQGAVNVRQFGARLDGSSDDGEALRRAYESGAPAVVIDGPLRLSQPLRIDRPFALFGEGQGPHLVWTAAHPGSGVSALLSVEAPQAADPAAFVRDLWIDGIHAVRERTGTGLMVLLQAINLRGLTVRGCTTRNMGLAVVKHRRMLTGDYLRLAAARQAKGSAAPTVDPAVLAGFSATGFDDLNEDLSVIDNDVDNGVYQAPLLRFEMARRVVVAGNRGRFANVSWWGGGAKATQGGEARFLRRARDIYIADNTLSGANGNIYGNNGQNVIVARNAVADAIDTAIDFEGCFDCHAYDNTVKNAGNFGLSTFYLARNVVFERNVVEQDGSAVDMARRFATRQIGGGRSIALVALRSAGFAKSPDISVRFIGNHLTYSGPDGIGVCLPSYYDSLEFTDNVLHNVACDWRYLLTRSVVIRNNRLTFDRAPSSPVTLIGGAAGSGTISGNQVQVQVPMPAGSAGIGYEVASIPGAVRIADNTVKGSGAGSVPIVLKPWRGLPRAALQVSNNAVPGLTMDPTLDAVARLDRPAAGIKRGAGLTLPTYPPRVRPGAE